MRLMVCTAESGGGEGFLIHPGGRPSFERLVTCKMDLQSSTLPHQYEDDPAVLIWNSTADDLMDHLSSNLTIHPLPPGFSGDDDNPHSFIFMENAEEMLLPWKSNPNFVPIVLTHFITFIVGLAGNLIVIGTMSRRHGERSVTSMFLVSLAVADLLLVAVCAPLETFGYFLNPWTKGARLCQLQAYVEMLSAVASVLNLTAVSLERYLVIVYPMQSRSLCTVHNCRRALIFVWIFSLILTAPVIVTRESVTYVYFNNVTSVAVHYCMDSEDIGQGGASNEDGLLGTYGAFLIALYQLLILLVLPSLLMIVCYSRVIKELWLSTKQITAMTTTAPAASSHTQHQNHNNWAADSSPGGVAVISGGGPPGGAGRINRMKGRTMSQQGDGAKQARKQVIKMLILVVFLFLACWGPRLLLNTLIKWGLSSFDHTVYELRIAFNLMPFIHSCINPVIYGFMSSNFRRTMVRCCARGRRKCSSACCCCCWNLGGHHTIRPNSMMEMTSNGNGLGRGCPSTVAYPDPQTEATRTAIYCASHDL